MTATKRNKKQTVTFTLTDDVMDKVRKESAKGHRTVSGFLRWKLEQHFSKKEDAQ